MMLSRCSPHWSFGVGTKDHTKQRPGHRFANEIDRASTFSERKRRRKPLVSLESSCAFAIIRHALQGGSPCGVSVVPHFSSIFIACFTGPGCATRACRTPLLP